MKNTVDSLPTSDKDGVTPQDARSHIHLAPLEDEMLEVIYHFDDFTTSDLQGIISAILLKAYTLGKEPRP